jgi:hypothetical protein
MEGLAAQNQLAAAGAGVNYGQVGGGCVRSGPARRPGEKAFVSLFRLRSVPSARGAARDRHAPGAARGRAAPTATRALTFEPPLASLPPHQVDVHPRVHRKRPADAPGVAPRELVPSRGALRGAPILPPRLRPQPGRRGRGPRGGPGRGTERAEHVHQRVRPPPPPFAPTPDRAGPRRPRDVRNVGDRRNLGRPFFRPRPASDDDDDGSFASPRTRLRADRHPRLATRSSAARRGGDERWTRAVSARRSSPRPSVSSPAGRRAGDGLFRPFSLAFAQKVF